MACETLVFEWNGEDTSQFEGSAAFTDGGGAGNLSVTSSAEFGNFLRVSGTAGTSAHVSILAVDPIVFPDDRRDLRFEIDFLDHTTGSGQYTGVIVCADDVGDYHGVNQYVVGSAEWGSRIDAASRLNATGTGGLIGTNGGFVEVEARGFKSDGSPLSLSVYSLAWTTSAASGAPRRTGNVRGSVRAFGNATALPSSWDNLACDRWGLTIQSSGGNLLANLKADILSLKVYRIG